ncbi:UDP-N-acetylglucosamine--dolichyl-phosphate N-acetylglucosaminephosphotransferase [Ceratocystis platani]|uniref:UDP-N-acetylglucosamine--dolichyl-phosphate N-acetylglucosaminephosphotransferase n=1 Tax=Ceratocystis fimbriata f. sp. platani TaxID=88771 RepID=A0A0F8BXJ9_CERFI|nr:UDP-N-acetylglucosamine--dolichyl-phosphate N-acetylglucosaminephosphotransferase [Ceratocystis platani]
MSDIEEPRFNSLADRIKALNQNQALASPSAVPAFRRPPPPPPPTVQNKVADPFPSPTDKARAIFTWHHHNIDYDWAAFSSGCVRPMTPDDVIREGKGVCAGYADCFEAIARRAGLQCIVISGHGKGIGHADLEPGQPVPRENATGHAWNAVQIDNGEWKLIDACWGAGSVSNNRYQRGFSPQYFCASNEVFGLRHFPRDKAHFLRADGRTPSWAEYFLGPSNGPAPLLFADFSKEDLSPISVSPAGRDINAADTEPVRIQFSRVVSTGHSASEKLSLISISFASISVLAHALSQEASEPLLASLALSGLAFVLCYAMIRWLGPTFMKAGFRGRDLCKSQQPEIPECMGAICAVVYILVVIAFIPFPFFKDIVAATSGGGNKDVVFTMSGSGPEHVQQGRLLHKFPHNKLASYLSAIISLQCIALLGVGDDLFDIRWRYKWWIPGLASIPILTVYFVDFGVTSIIIPTPLQPYLGELFDLGALYYVYMACVAMFCPQIGILGHFSKTLGLLLVPQLFNFLFSTPQIFGLIPCPRHRLPRFNPKTGLLEPSVTPWTPGKQPIMPMAYILRLLGTLHCVSVTEDKDGNFAETSNLTLLNLWLVLRGPLREDRLAMEITMLQLVVGLCGLFVRHRLALLVFQADNWSMLSA